MVRLSFGAYNPKEKLLTFYSTFNKELEDEFTTFLIESKCETIDLNKMFNKPLPILPPTIKKIKAGRGFNQLIDHLPDSVESIELGYCFNQPISKYPANLKKIMFYGQFNQQLVNLPSSIEEIILSYQFNHPLDNLPYGLKKLDLGRKFNQEVEHLPDSLTEIVFSDFFDNNIDFLPQSIKKIELGINFNKELENLPSSLETLIVGAYIKTLNNLPDHIKEINIEKRGTRINLLYKPILKLPDNLVKLTLNSCYIDPIEYFPPNLKSLIFPESSNFNLPLDNLPDSLDELILGQNYNQNLKNIPKSVKILSIGHGYRFPLSELPDTIEVLRVGIIFKSDRIPSGVKKLNISLPIDFESIEREFNDQVRINTEFTLSYLENLKYLKIENFFFYSLDNLPVSLENLEITSNSRFPIKNFPPNLKNLILNNSGKHDLTKLPDSLETLEIYISNPEELTFLPPNLRLLSIKESITYTFSSRKEKYYYNFSIIPSSLKEIKLLGSFDFNIDSLPSTIEIIKIGSSFTQKISKLPKNLITLEMNYYYIYRQHLFITLFKYRNKFKKTIDLIFEKEFF